ncbi:hypothetical protein EKO27_g3787 [Xylaria grammica]|uniref:Sialidase domain-containing protein n=1 Tax=Xylaria grammica TaxID=363999 RepID=A0A439DAA2_9PEZI|nr:hypothetical protein EKO27_g3787 [Xylaria grammica]
MLSVIYTVAKAVFSQRFKAPAFLGKCLAAGQVVRASNTIIIDSAGVYIRVTALNGGGLIAGYAATDGTQHVLRTAKSTDGGQSWFPQGEVYRADRTLHDVDNAFPLQLSSGRILYAYRNHDRTSSGQYTYYRITVSYSDDGGKTFLYLSTVAQRAASGVNGLWEPFLRVANDGSLQCYYSGENSATDQDGYMRQSTDGGLTWSSPITISGAGVTSRDGMIGVAKIDGNNLIAVFENTEIGRFSIDYVRSHDDGRSWGERGRLYTAANNAEAIAPQICNVGGTLVASFMTDESIGGTGADGGQMKVVTSTNGGNTWSGSVVTGEVASHWPGLFTRDSTHFLALYSKDGLGAVSQLYQVT